MAESRILEGEVREFTPAGGPMEGVKLQTVCPHEPTISAEEQWSAACQAVAGARKRLADAETAFAAADKECQDAGAELARARTALRDASERRVAEVG